MTSAATSVRKRRWLEVRDEIARACAEARRDPATVTLVAISKTFGADAIEPVIAAGQRVFGENRVQEAKAKWPALRERHPDIELHLVGPLQSNKAKEAVALFDAIHSVDRPSLARGAGQGNRQAEPPADAVRRDQYRRRAAEGRRAAGRHRRIPQDLPRELRPRYRGADVHPPGRRASGAALRPDRQDRAPQRPHSSCPWA